MGLFQLAVSIALATVGELYLAPVGLAFVSDTAPEELTAFVMGIWFIASSIGSAPPPPLPPRVTALMERPSGRRQQPHPTPPWLCRFYVCGALGTLYSSLPLTGFFALLAAIAATNGVAMLVARPLLRRLLLAAS